MAGGRHRDAAVWLAALLLGGLFAVNVYRAATQAITVDEAFTWRRFVAAPLADMCTFYDANNHVLYSLLAKLSTAALPAGEFALRLPSLAGGLLYFAALFMLARRVFGSGAWFLAAVALAGMNPFLLDFLSAARGYGLALALWMWALVALDARREVTAGLLMGLSVTANLVMLVPCAALGASWAVLAAMRDGRVAASAVRLAAAAAAVAGPVLGFALHAARRADFYDGADTAREAAYALAEASLLYTAASPEAGWTARALLHEWALPLFLAALAAFALLLVHEVRARAAPATSLVLGSLLGSAVVLVLLRKGLDVLYPRGRTALYLVPLVSLAFVLVLARLNGPRLARRAVVGVGLLVLAAVLTQYLVAFNTRYYFEFRFDSGSRRIAERLKQFQAETGSPLRVGASPVPVESLRFYRQVFACKWLEPARLNDPPCLFDYYVLMPEDRDTSFRRYRLEEVYRDGIAGTLLARPRPNAFPEVAELRRAGYRDPIPCEVDFDRVGPAVKLAAPESAAHVLRDVVGAPGPWDSVWIGPRPALVFRLPEARSRELALDLVIHDLVLTRSGPQTLTIRVNSHTLGSVTYSTGGRKTYRRTVPAEWLREGGITLLEIETPHYLTAEEDGRKLAFLLSRAEFARP